MSYVQKRGGKLIKNKLKADALTSSRTIAISGGATGTATSFDGSANITIPVTDLDISKASAGTLPVSRGGTGQTSVSDIQAGKDGSGNTITTTYATKQELQNALEGAVTILPNTTLPNNPSQGVFYLVPTDTANVYDRYVWEGNAWVNLGVSSLNLTNYSTKAQTVNSFSVSGTTVTYTMADGTTSSSFTTQDENVRNTLATTTKAYITGTTSATTSTSGQVFDSGVYLSTTAGELVATTFKGSLDGTADKATKDGSGNTITTTYTTDTNFVKAINALYDITSSLQNLMTFLYDYYEITATSDSE